MKENQFIELFGHGQIPDQINNQTIIDTPMMDEMINELKNCTEKINLIELAQFQAHLRQFKVFAPTDPQCNLEVVRLRCRNYRDVRCPFIMSYYRTRPSPYFNLRQYRSEHNHPLNPDFTLWGGCYSNRRGQPDRSKLYVDPNSLKKKGALAFDEDLEAILLPFIIRRLERNNNNGERKQNNLK